LSIRTSVKRSAQIPIHNCQNPPKKPRLGSFQTPQKSIHRPKLGPGPGQPLRMVFRRLDNSWWSSRFVTVPSSHPPEKPASPVQSPHVLRNSEGRCPRVAVSVLYEDLQVSSSSEDSDWA
ncbi:putative protein FAM90A10P, partial [Carlito syrichta]|uniref:Uncharacterized protein n=1 Tax=Carlito syrichta TaxID=1868482 RepID=A0A3Q0DSJ4_CARSF